MKYCPECGNLMVNNRCQCGFVYKEFDVDKEKSQTISNAAPTQTSTNDINQNVNSPEVTNNNLSNYSTADEDLYKFINDPNYKVQ